jgi:Tol biopolymer transport system component
LSISIATAAAGQTAWTPEMQVRTKMPASPRISPDGTRVVYTVNEAVMTADKSEFVTQVWMGSADGKENYQVTFGDKSSTNPKWSPDGRSIAFTSNRKDNKNNLYVLRVSGGEAEPITDLKSSIADFEWSPDGTRIAYAMSDAKSDDEEKNDKGKNDFRWVDENQKMTRLYVVPVAKDADGKREPRKLTSENRNVTGFSWSPDGTRIVYNHVSTASANDWTSSDISIVDVAS